MPSCPVVKLDDPSTALVFRGVLMISSVVRQALAISTPIFALIIPCLEHLCAEFHQELLVVHLLSSDLPFPATEQMQVDHEPTGRRAFACATIDNVDIGTCRFPARVVVIVKLPDDSINHCVLEPDVLILLAENVQSRQPLGFTIVQRPKGFISA